MIYSRDVEYFKKLLAENPSLRRPKPLDNISNPYAQSREWKSASRCYDAARIELGVCSPDKIQQENSIFAYAGMIPRVIGYVTLP